MTEMLSLVVRTLSSDLGLWDLWLILLGSPFSPIWEHSKVVWYKKYNVNLSVVA